MKTFLVVNSRYIAGIYGDINAPVHYYRVARVEPSSMRPNHFIVWSTRSNNKIMAEINKGLG